MPRKMLEAVAVRLWSWAKKENFRLVLEVLFSVEIIGDSSRLL